MHRQYNADGHGLPVTCNVWARQKILPRDARNIPADALIQPPSRAAELPMHDASGRR